MNQTECPKCHHPPLRHVPDGLGTTCLVCLWELQELIKRSAHGLLSGQERVPRVCTQRFEFTIQGREREQAMRAYKEAFEPHTVCIQCACDWQQHMGYLCPSGDTLFVPLLETDPGVGVVGDS
jgi:hypothetical protein